MIFTWRTVLTCSAVALSLVWMQGGAAQVPDSSPVLRADKKLESTAGSRNVEAPLPPAKKKRQHYHSDEGRLDGGPLKPVDILSVKDLTAEQSKELARLQKEMKSSLRPLKQALLEKTGRRGKDMKEIDSARSTRGEKIGGAILGGLVSVNSEGQEKTGGVERGAGKPGAVKPDRNEAQSLEPGAKVHSPADLKRQVHSVKHRYLSLMLKVLTDKQRQELARDTGANLSAF